MYLKNLLVLPVEAGFDRNVHPLGKLSLLLKRLGSRSICGESFL